MMKSEIVSGSGRRQIPTLRYLPPSAMSDGAHTTALPSIQMNLSRVRASILGCASAEPHRTVGVQGGIQVDGKWQIANGQSFHELATGGAGLRGVVERM